MSINDSIKKKGSIFTPPVVRKLAFDSAFIEPETLSFLSASAILNTSSFEFDSYFNASLKNTQEIPIDFSKFENHTFFNSAESKVNVAFEKIINNYPFDGTATEFQNFISSLDGYEKHVLDNFPVYRGFLIFSGSKPHENPAAGWPAELGTHIKVANAKGAAFTQVSQDKTGAQNFNAQTRSITFEFHIFATPATNRNQIILQHKDTRPSGDFGITIGLKENSSTENCDLVMIASSGSDQVMTVTMPIIKNRFEHVLATYDRRPGHHNLKLYSSASLIASSSTSMEFPAYVNMAAPLLIGSGTAHITSSLPDADGTSGPHSFLPSITLSGAMDELRIFHSTRLISQQHRDRLANITPNDHNQLKLYYKFNEPTGSYPSNNMVLDSSGESMHSTVINFSLSNRSPELAYGQARSTPMALEDPRKNPTLFPLYPDLISFNGNLLTTASLYDIANPNLVTKLIPSHYFIEGQYEQGFADEFGDLGKSIAGSSNSTPGTANAGSGQLLASILFLWAQQFDQIKMFLDHFSKLRTIDYLDEDTMANKFLPQFAAYFGFQLPNLYRDADINAYVDGKDLNPDRTLPLRSLRQVQNQIWRRLLTNLPSLIRSKGTIHSIRSLIRAAGLNPDHNFRLREFGGPKLKKIGVGREVILKDLKMLDFSGSLASGPNTENSQGFGSIMPYIMSPFLSSSRSEIGLPTIAGEMVSTTDSIRNGFINGVSNNENDGLFTSSSFTIEGLYLFTPGAKYSSYSSLARLHTTGANTIHAPGDAFHNVIANMVATSASIDNGITGSLSLFVRDGSTTSLATSPLFQLHITGVDVYDGRPFYASFGRYGNEEINSDVSSSYFLRYGKGNGSDVIDFMSTGSLHQAQTTSFANNVFSTRSTLNTSGSFFVIGSQSISHKTNYLNDNTLGMMDLVRCTMFEGKVKSLRFYSKALANSECLEHIRNPKSFGVDNPFTSINDISISLSGSFKRLRINADMEQPTTASDTSGGVQIVDFSQTFISGSRILPTRASDIYDSLYSMVTGSSFEKDVRVIKPVTFYYSRLDPKFDERATTNKIRIRGMDRHENIEKYNASAAPVSQIDLSEEVIDDKRFIIEHSAVRALNDDITRLFAVFDEFDSLLGNPNLEFAEEYPNFRFLRDVYFKRLEGKMNFKKLFEFFKWFDDSLGIFIDNFVPYKTDFFGVQFMIESHILERAKFSYFHYDQFVNFATVESSYVDSMVTNMGPVGNMIDSMELEQIAVQSVQDSADAWEKPDNL